MQKQSLFFLKKNATNKNNINCGLYDAPVDILYMKFKITQKPFQGAFTENNVEMLDLCIPEKCFFVVFLEWHGAVANFYFLNSISL